MNKKYKALVIFLLVVSLIILLGIFLSHHTIAVLQPKGPIAEQEKHLLITAFLMMLVIVIPVFALTAYIVWKYREGHKHDYRPDFNNSNALEITWWIIPSALILVLSIMTWNYSYKLDPYKTIDSSTKALNIEAIALNWKWLFIYPDNNVASVNELNIPVNTPINLYITADSPMNSLWIPQLSGQMYAMAGMSTQLHLLANQTGSFYGSSANISGDGFSGMHFMTRSLNNADYSNWLMQASMSKNTLTISDYNVLAKPTSDNPVTYYSNASNGIYPYVINKYMGSMGMPGMSSNMPPVTTPQSSSNKASNNMNMDMKMNMKMGNN